MRKTLVVLLLLTPITARADVAQSIEQARAAEESLDYDIATDLWMTVIGDPAVTDEQRFEAHLRSGVLQVILGNESTARLHFRYVLQRDVDHRLPDETSPKVRGYFELVREEVRAELARARPPPAPAQRAPADPALDRAAEPVVKSTWGWWVTAGVGAVLVAAGAGLAAAGSVPALEAGAADRLASEATVQVTRQGHYETRDQAAFTANALYGLGALVGVVGVAVLGVGVVGAL